MEIRPTDSNKIRLPYSTAVLVLGISSIALCCCYGIPGIATGIIALVLYQKDFATYSKNKDQYDNFDSLRTGRTLSMIGITISAVYLIYLIVVLNIYGVEALSNPKLLIDNMNK